MQLKDLSISVDAIRISADPGTPISFALRGAVILAFTEQQSVILTFNDKEYEIDHAKILNSIYFKEK